MLTARVVDFLQAPFAKMLRKGFARIMLLDCLKERQGSNQHTSSSAPTTSTKAAPSLPASGSQDANLLCQQSQKIFGGVDIEGREDSKAELRGMLDGIEQGAVEDVLNRDVEQAAIRASASEFGRMVAPGTLLGVECGNMYTGQSSNLS